MVIFNSNLLVYQRVSIHQIMDFPFAVFDQFQSSLDNFPFFMIKSHVWRWNSQGLKFLGVFKESVKLDLGE